MSKAFVYSDGGAAPNPGRGAWAAVVALEDNPPVTISGSETGVTNNQMEMCAALNGIREARRLGANEIEVVSDSQYLVNGMIRRLYGWEMGRAPKASPDVPNRTLWEQLVLACKGVPTTWTWVKGHSIHASNNRADALCRALLARY